MNNNTQQLIVIRVLTSSEKTTLRQSRNKMKQHSSVAFFDFIASISY